jgi:hypothetical protein
MIDEDSTDEWRLNLINGRAVGGQKENNTLQTATATVHYLYTDHNWLMWSDGSSLWKCRCKKNAHKHAHAPHMHVLQRVYECMYVSTAVVAAELR